MTQQDTNISVNPNSRATCLTCGAEVPSELWGSTQGKMRVDVGPHDATHTINIEINLLDIKP